MNEIKAGEWLPDYKANMVYRVDSVKKLENGKTVVLCENRVSSKESSIVGYDVLVLNRDLIIPTSEMWGKRAWSWCTKEQALKCYGEIN